MIQRKEHQMLLSELRERLEELEDLDGDTPVYIGHQPNWPLALNVAGIIHFQDQEIECPDHEGYLLEHDQDCLNNYEDPDGELPFDDDRRALWIVGGEHPYDRSPYAPRFLWQEEGWK